ncbi:hypothetical protein HK102_005238 [Quaeritorhiza haematococci]|nr:hypothetical protein HK102_005238 [Quaeritorhiza haematococci]
MSSSKEAFSLSRMMQHLTTIIVIEIAALAALSIVGEPGAGVVEKTIDLRGIGSYTQQECAPLNQITVVTLISINVVLIIFSSYTAWMSRKVPDSFNETKFVVVAILLISFTAIVVLPVLLTFGGLTSGYLLGSLAVNFATTFSMGVFALPKLWMARLNVKSKVSDFPGRTVARTVAVDVNDM